MTRLSVLSQLVLRRRQTGVRALRSDNLRTLSLVVVLALLTAACGGPKAPLEIGHSEFPTNVILGSKKKPVPPSVLPIPPSPIELAAPRFFAPVPSDPEVSVPTTAPPPACPKGDPRDAPKEIAPNTMALPPAPATYVFRNRGTFDVGGANASKGGYADITATRTVRAVKKTAASLTAPAHYTWEVVATLADTATTTTFRLDPEPPGGGGGLSIVKIVTETAGTAPQVFEPSPAISLLTFPIETGQTTGERVAAGPGTVMEYVRTVGQKIEVDACGEPLDAIGVTVKGNIATARNVADRDVIGFEAQYAIATQFGGLFVQDAVKVSGTERGAPVTRENVADINSVPSGPKDVA